MVLACRGSAVDFGRLSTWVVALGLVASRDALAHPHEAVVQLDRDQLTRLEHRLDHRLVRVVGPFGTRTVPSVGLQETGIFVPADSATAGSGPDVSLVRWQDVESIAVRKKATGPGAAWGAAAGTAAGIGILTLAVDDAGGSGWSGLAAAVGLGITVGLAASGGLVGAIVGSRFEHWDEVYPEPPSGGHDARSAKPFLKPPAQKPKKPKQPDSE